MDSVEGCDRGTNDPPKAASLSRDSKCGTVGIAGLKRAQSSRSVLHDITVSPQAIAAVSGGCRRLSSKAAMFMNPRAKVSKQLSDYAGQQHMAVQRARPFISDQV